LDFSHPRLIRTTLAGRFITDTTKRILMKSKKNKPLFLTFPREDDIEKRF